MDNRGPPQAKRACLASPGTETCVAASSSRGFDLNEHVEARRHKNSPSEQHRTSPSEQRRGSPSEQRRCSPSEQQHQSSPLEQPRNSPSEQQRHEERTFFPSKADAGPEKRREIGVERVPEVKDGACKGRVVGLKGRAAMAKEKDKKQPPPQQQQQQQHKVDDPARSVAVLADLLKAMQNGAGHLLRCRALEYEKLVPVLEGAQSLVDALVRGMHKAREQEKAKNCEKSSAEHAEREEEMDRLRKEHEAEIARLRKTQEVEVEKEQERITCKICLCKPRDAMILPCLHFDYCFSCLQAHQQRSSSCPTCRGTISGMLKCNLSL